nr:RNA-directed DNA polymerase, eukaryota [Tanacetum cinerariifolium]
MLTVKNHRHVKIEIRIGSWWSETTMFASAIKKKRSSGLFLSIANDMLRLLFRMSTSAHVQSEEKPGRPEELDSESKAELEPETLFSSVFDFYFLQNFVSESIRSSSVLIDSRPTLIRVEQEQFQHVDRISRSVKLNSNNDSWTWNLEKSGMFSVASVRKMIDDALIHSPNLNYRWNKYVPIKVNILVWKILNNSLPTKFNISRRGILIDSIICPNCDDGVETVGHLFFSCSMSRDIFNLIARWWKVSIQYFDCYDEWLEWIDSILHGG